MSTKKILKIDSLKSKIDAFRKAGKLIAFTNGCFDILHVGHVRYLQKAKGPDRILIVGLNSDVSVKKIKGPKRPIVQETDRAEVLAGLDCVDFVILFSESTPLKLIEALKPDVLIKGADWKGKGIVGEDVVKAHGGRVELMTYVENRSSTNIIDKILTQG